MEIKHATVKAPGDRLYAIADWNATHKLNIVSSVKAAVVMQEFITGEWEPINYDSSFGWDVGGEWDNTTHEFTANADGYYLVIASIGLMPVISTTDFEFGIKVDGPVTTITPVRHIRIYEVRQVPPGNEIRKFTAQVNCICKLRAGEKILISAYSNVTAKTVEDEQVNQLFIQKIS
ncbi:MAG: hypothetical protein QXO15_10440 [Nitrososphaerota archaeon]